MSMILDAIKRSKEGPEGVGSVPSLDTEHYVAPDRPIWKKAVFKRASLAALGVMVVVVAVLYSSVRDGSDSSVAKGGDSAEEAADQKTADPVAATPKNIGPDAKSQKPLISSTPVLVSSTKDDSSRLSSGAIRATRPVVIPTETQPAKNSGPNAEALSSLYAAMNEEVDAAFDSSMASDAEIETAPDAVDQAAEI